VRGRGKAAQPPSSRFQRPVSVSQPSKKASGGLRRAWSTSVPVLWVPIAGRECAMGAQILAPKPYFF